MSTNPIPTQGMPIPTHMTGIMVDAYAPPAIPLGTARVGSYNPPPSPTPLQQRMDSIDVHLADISAKLGPLPQGPRPIVVSDERARLEAFAEGTRHAWETIRAMSIPDTCDDKKSYVDILQTLKNLVGKADKAALDYKAAL